MMTEKRIWELLARQFTGEITPDEQLELESLLGRQQEKAPYGELLSDVHMLSLQPDMGDRQGKERSLSAIRNAIRESEAVTTLAAEEDIQPGGMKKRMQWALGLTAILLALPIAWILWRPVRISATAEPFDRILTKNGSKTLINLPDSSTVVLSSACQFSYNKNFGVRKREMHLTGEAYFDIHANPDMPLIVHAGNVLIRVLGTTFNVKANADDSFVEATLVKGAIEVSLVDDPERRILLRPGEKILIRNLKDSLSDKRTQPGQGQYKKDHEKNADMIKVSRIEDTAPDSSYVENAWLKDRLQFHKESLSSLARQMEKRYNVRIILADKSLEELMFTGSFEKETITEALQALRNSAPFDFRVEGSTVTITGRKK